MASHRQSLEAAGAKQAGPIPVGTQVANGVFSSAIVGKDEATSGP